MQNKITLIANPTVAAIHQPTIEQKQELLSALSYQVMGYEQTYKFKTGAWDGRSSFFDWSSNTFPAGFLLFAAAKLRQKGYEVAVVRKPLPEPKGPIRPKVGDYPDDPRYEYQYEAVNRLVKYGGMIAMLATGAGKSRVAELAFSRIRRPTLFLTTRSLLMYQMKNNVERDFKIPVSVIGDGEFGLDGDKTKLGLFTVATVQTLTSRLSGPDIHDRGETKRTKLAIQKQTLELLKKFQLVILEEAHEVSAGGYFEICKHCTNAAYRLALTATPFMKEDEEANMRLMGSSGPIGIRVTEKQLIDCGILARPYFKTIHLTQRPKKLFNSTKWASAYRLGIVLNEERNQKIIQEALRAKEHGLSVMCLVQQKDHGKILKQMMEKAGLKANFIFGEDKAKERQTNLAQLKNKEIDVLIGSTILDVGVDVPAVGMVILAGAGKTQVANRQRIGRGLRAKKEGPNVCFVVDFDDPFNKYLVEHAMLRRRIIMTTPGFNEGFVTDFPYELFEKVNK